MKGALSNASEVLGIQQSALYMTGGPVAFQGKEAQTYSEAWLLEKMNHLQKCECLNRTGIQWVCEQLQIWEEGAAINTLLEVVKEEDEFYHDTAS